MSGALRRSAEPLRRRPAPGAGKAVRMSLRVLLAGLGVRGSHWAEVLRRSPRAQLVAWADPDPAALARAGERFGARPAYKSAAAALAQRDDIDALLLASPPVGREDDMRAAAERGLALLVEKPLALDLAEAAQLVRVAESGGVPLMVGLNFRYLAATQATRQLLAESIVGAPAFARFTYERWRDGARSDLNKYPLHMEQPMLWEQTIHHYDLLRYVYGRAPLDVRCHTWNPPWSMYAGDANVSAILTFDGGLVVNYQGTWQANWSRPHFEWRSECSEGVICWQDQFGELGHARHEEGELKRVPLPPHERWLTETSALLDAFLDATLEGTPLECSGRDHLVSLAMVAASIRSSHEGRAVTIAEELAVAGAAP